MRTVTRPLSVAEDAAALEAIESEPSLRVALLGHALLLGVAGNALMREPGSGLAFPLWILLLALSTVALTWRSRSELPREAAFWLLSAILFAAFTAWRSSEPLQAMNVLATAGALGMAAVALADESAALFARRLRDTVWAGVDVVRSTAAGLLPTALRALRSPAARVHASGRVGPVARAGFIAVTLLLVFGSLLRSADPVFASLISLPAIDGEELFANVFFTGFYAWIVAGWVRGALRVDRVATRAPDALPITLGPLDITTALTTLIVLFSVFVVSQLGLLFGGEQFLHERTGLTAASYARQGFFQLVFAIALVLPVLMVTRAAMHSEPGLARRHTALSLPLIVLLGATMISAVARMQLYVRYYGLTTDRLYPLVFMGWLAMVLVWFAFTVLRDTPRFFVGGALLSGALTLAALNVSEPDAIVARANLQRAADGPADIATPLDLRYLARLSGSAVPLAVRATLDPTTAVATQERCGAARELLRSWGPASRRAEQARSFASWRTWNAGAAEAMRVVGAHSAALRTVQHQTCAPRFAAPRYQPR